MSIYKTHVVKGIAKMSNDVNNAQEDSPTVSQNNKLSTQQKDGSVKYHNTPYCGVAPLSDESMQKLKDHIEQKRIKHLNKLIGDVEDEIKAGTKLGGDPLIPLGQLKETINKIQNSGIHGQQANTMTHKQGEYQYLNLLRRVLDEGTFKGDRTGVGCTSIRGAMMCFDLTDGKIPLLTTKKMGIKSIIAELLWFLEGSTDNDRLNELGATIWNEWALEDGSLGPIYGKQWTAWEAPNKRILNRLVADVENNIPGSLAKLKEEINNPPTINQIEQLITTLKENPNSRRMLVTAWNPAVLPHDYYWEHDLLYAGEYVHALDNGWEAMDTQTRLTWMKDMDWCYSKMMDIDHIDTLGVPNVRRRLKLSPQDNVECGRASLPACHTMFQVHTRELMTHERMEWLRINNVHAWNPIINHPLELYSDDDRMDNLDVPKYALTLQFFARSQDAPLGTPYNIASYGILAQMLAHCTGMIAEELIYMAGDIHIYQGQEAGVREQLTRKPHAWPRLKLNLRKKDIFSFEVSDFGLVDYTYHPKIDFGPVAV